MSRGVLVRLGLFVVVALVAGLLELNTLTGPHVGTTHEYHAIFGGSDGVSGLRTGDDVRVAGVVVGEVTDEKLTDAEHVDVTFSANEHQTLTSHTWAVVRYANLLGQRYLALTQSDGPGTPLQHGDTIPQQRTAPALSLTALFNGFRPLFTGLSPQQVNELSGDIVGVLQGQAGRIDDLVSRTADLTGNLAQRSDTFSQVIDSLTTLLSTVAAHDDRLAATLTALQALTAALHKDGPGILDSLDAIDALTGSVGNLLGALENHNLPGDIADLNAITGVVAKNSTALNKLLTGAVRAFGDFARITQSGNWANIYLCSMSIQSYGQATVTGADIVHNLEDVLGPQLGALLGRLGLGTATLAKLALPLPVTIPNGRVGSSTAQTDACR
jgi:phospholipid/cholesterol/gamma-HCH transport system substrate-binding protein